MPASVQGEVYLAEDTKLKREVAIKFLPDAMRDDPERLRRLRIDVVENWAREFAEAQPD